MESKATIPTAHAKRYLGQFCKHFAHKLPVELAETNETGQVTFGDGTCSLRADAQSLHLAIAVATSEQLANLQGVVARHLVRFAFREELPITWH